VCSRTDPTLRRRYGDRVPVPPDPRDPVIEHWSQLSSLPSARIPLDDAVLTIARCHRPSLDLVGGLARLDDLAGTCPTPTLDGIVRHLHGDLGFRGAVDRYDDPANSFLDQVLDRRIGLPITLSVVLVEVARRVGVTLHGVGLPGHFIVGSSDEPGRFVDPYDGGTLLDHDGVRALFRRVSNGSPHWDDRWLLPVDNRAILARMLNNLKASYVRRNDSVGLWWVLRLRARLSAELMTEDRVDRPRLVAGLN
jgi:regulator of sirC expression with transglutaminase-like and TPR domain